MGVQKVVINIVLILILISILSTSISAEWYKQSDKITIGNEDYTVMYDVFREKLLLRGLQNLLFEEGECNPKGYYEICFNATRLDPNNGIGTLNTYRRYYIPEVFIEINDYVPELRAKLDIYPKQPIINEEVTLTITITNPGKTIENAVVQILLPDGLYNEQGRLLQWITDIQDTKIIKTNVKVFNTLSRDMSVRIYYDLENISYILYSPNEHITTKQLFYHTFEPKIIEDNVAFKLKIKALEDITLEAWFELPPGIEIISKDFYRNANDGRRLLLKLNKGENIIKEADIIVTTNKESFIRFGLRAETLSETNEYLHIIPIKKNINTDFEITTLQITKDKKNVTKIIEISKKQKPTFWKGFFLWMKTLF